MAKNLKILKLGDPLLREKCAPIEEITDEIKELAEDMVLTILMTNGHGLALAAPQVGKIVRMIAMVTDKYVGVMINPTIRALSEDMIDFEEGCLSIPGTYINTGVRHQAVKVQFQDVDGNEREELFDGLTSVAIQHEIDHLDGILMVDYEENS